MLLDDCGCDFYLEEVAELPEFLRRPRVLEQDSIDVERVEFAGAMAIDSLPDTGYELSQLGEVIVRYHQARGSSLLIRGHELRLLRVISLRQMKETRKVLMSCEDARMRTHGWPYLFQAVAWETTASFLRDIADRHTEFTHMARIAESVVATETTTLLAGCTSMHDLIVVPVPIPDPPYDVIAVRAPGSIRNTPTGHVSIEHLSCSGHNDVIQRPTSDAVPLFWRFVIEKYGIRPVSAPVHPPT